MDGKGEVMSDYLNNSKKYKGFHYSVLSENELKYLHNKTLEMLKIIIPIFKNYNIRYMICGGTLLGAITTGKFIPWDDDVDICVLENDYDKMVKALLTELPDWMVCQCKETEPKYYHGWIKIRDKNSHVYPDSPVYQYNGVWIDIYKLTLAEKRNVELMIKQEHFDYLNIRYDVGDISQEERDKRIKENNLILAINTLKNEADKNEDTDKIYIIWSASKILIEPEWCLPANTYIFEGMKLCSFHNAEAYLERHYGKEYMHLPPYEKRRVGINKVEIL